MNSQVPSRPWHNSPTGRCQHPLRWDRFSSFEDPKLLKNPSPFRAIAFVRSFRLNSRRLAGWKMPLVSDRKSKPLSHSNSRAIGIWMSVEGQIPVQPVRVLVSYEALSQLDPTNVRDLHGALQNFDRLRSQVEAAASREFDRNGFNAEKYEGMPAIRLTADDLT
jgi:hypothetical protein